MSNEPIGKKFEYPNEIICPSDIEGKKSIVMERRLGIYIQLHPNSSSDVDCYAAIETDIVKV